LNPTFLVSPLRATCPANISMIPLRGLTYCRNEGEHRTVSSSSASSALTGGTGVAQYSDSVTGCTIRVSIPGSSNMFLSPPALGPTQLPVNERRSADGYPRTYSAEVKELYLHPPIRLHTVFTDSFTVTLVVTDCQFRPQKPFVSCRRFGFTIRTAVKIVTACSADGPNNVLVPCSA
jgi:hypothetical protein